MESDDSSDDLSPLLVPAPPPDSARTERTPLLDAPGADAAAAAELDHGSDMGRGFIQPTIAQGSQLEHVYYHPPGHLLHQLSSRSLQERWRRVVSRAPYYLPVLGWLPSYQPNLLFFDIMSGISVSLMLIPQSISYSKLAGLPPKWGLYTSFVPVLLYAIFGTCRQLSVGAEAVISILVGTTLHVYSDLGERLEMAAVLGLLVGLLCLGLGLFRLGFLSSILSRALIEGFMLGSACVIMIEQLPSLFGIEHPEEGSTAMEGLIHFFRNLSNVHGASTAFGLGSLAFLVGFLVLRKIFPRSQALLFFPAVLVLVVLTTIISWKTHAAEHGVIILGDLHTGFFTPSAPRLTASRLSSLIGPAAIITVVGFVEANATAKKFAAEHNYMVSANRELVAFGLANVLGSFFGAYPVFASLPRSSLQNSAGGRTQMTGFAVFLMVGLTLGIVLPLFDDLPQAVMGAIVFNAALSLVHTEQLHFIVRTRSYADGSMLTLCFLVIFFLGVDTGVLVALCVSVLLIISRITLPRMSMLGRVADHHGFVSASEHPEAKIVDGLLIVKIEQNLFFFSSSSLKDLLRRIELLGDPTAHPSEKPRLPPVRAVIFDIRIMFDIDASATQELMEIITDFHQRNIEVCFVGLRNANKAIFLRSGLVQQIGADHIFSTIRSAKQFLSGQLHSQSTYNVDLDVTTESHA